MLIKITLSLIKDEKMYYAAKGEEKYYFYEIIIYSYTSIFNIMMNRTGFVGESIF